MTRTEERPEQPAAEGVAVDAVTARRRARPRISGARVATLVAGGTIVALLVAATAVGGLVALGVAQLDDRRFELPANITAIEVHAEGLNVQIVGSFDQSGDRVPSAIVRGLASSTLGPLPGIDIELRGTTAIITPEEPLRQLALGPYHLDVWLGDVALDRIDVVTQGYLSIQGVYAAEVHATSLYDTVYVGVRPESGLTLLDVASGNGPQIDLPEDDGPYRVLLPEWFDDEYVEQWWRDHYGLDYRTEVLGAMSGAQPGPGIATDAPAPTVADGEPTPTPIPGSERDRPSALDGPGVFVPTDPDAAVTIDLRDAGGDMLQVVSPEARDRAGR